MNIKGFTLDFAGLKILMAGYHNSRIGRIFRIGNILTYSLPVIKAIHKFREPTKADFMFYELGYNTGYSFAPNHTSWYKNKRGSHIYFKDKLIDLSGRGTGICLDNRNKLLTMKQLVAIVEKCKEEGWIKGDIEII